MLQRCARQSTARQVQRLGKEKKQGTPYDFPSECQEGTSANQLLSCENQGAIVLSNMHFTKTRPPNLTSKSTQPLPRLPRPAPGGLPSLTSTAQYVDSERSTNGPMEWKMIWNLRKRQLLPFPFHLQVWGCKGPDKIALKRTPMSWNVLNLLHQLGVYNSLISWRWTAPSNPDVFVRGSTSASSCATSGKRATCTVHGGWHSMCVQGPFLWFLVSLNDNLTMGIQYTIQLLTESTCKII